MFTAALAILICYILLISWFIFGFFKVKTFTNVSSYQSTTFSIIIPFRNEQNNLPELLQSLAVINYSYALYEIIFVDDDSVDQSEEIIKTWSESSAVKVTLLKNNRKSNSPKKDAIETAIQNATNDWIITTDADCKISKNWLLIFDSFIQEKNAKLVAGPVTYVINNNFLERFQLLDFLSLMGTTIGGFGTQKPFLCNGANLAYNKETFLNVNGYQNNNEIASGDDIFLLEKIQKAFPKDVYFLKSEDAIVTTKAENSFKKACAQRKRWASKTSKHPSAYIKLVGALVFLMNLIFVMFLLLGIFKIVSFKQFLVLYVFKFNVDFFLLYNTAYFFNQEKEMKGFLISSLWYPFFTIYIAVSSFFGGYKWKGRRFKR
ncbi:glycosyltransferase [Zhouia sp. PK063]|uniref:glycosyltransferase family 2 protein n=1 Tax=Zhouia sp. PK063 TaxID=3373602 RepID=UPI00378FBACD